ncbi:MAG TPA: T9SS type B sorting domain-containing protein [Pricia antarctica]|uniref:T9SS type B sorting domain-containing protein n=2 Tax=root TaxID=1 RepID=A0A831QQ23_9FLAO|nr:T9SS type B sorting domain-containing protein [Pricia antarctica]
MQRGLLFVLFFVTALLGHAQTCSTLTQPRDGAVNIPVDTRVAWSEITDNIGFVVSFGTTPGDGDIIRNRSSGLNNFYVPQTGLPADTQIYVTISYYKAGQDFTTCETETFRTAPITSPPGCTRLTEPLNAAVNIAAETKLEWEYAPTATGYLISVGTAPNLNDVFDNLDVGNVLSFEPPEGLPADQSVYVTLTPYNDVGRASSCSVESFSTTSVVIDCGPFFDYRTGETLNLGPEIDFPEFIGLCKDQVTLSVESEDKADGYRWYSFTSDGAETLISSNRSVELPSVGTYRYEAYNYITRSTSTVECAKSKVFTVIPSESAIITSVEDTQAPLGRTLVINITGDGVYEFALDNSEGPYQFANSFENVSSDFHFIYVRDQNGCGITESSVQRKLSSNDFPKFFTPNGDDVNDYWQYIVPEIKQEIVLTTLHIFDRFGNLLADIDPDSQGWDGTFIGRKLPSSDYWFRAIAVNGEEVKGHFTLKR